jgi:hypothetical protein
MAQFIFGSIVCGIFDRRSLLQSFASFCSERYKYSDQVHLSLPLKYLRSEPRDQVDGPACKVSPLDFNQAR